MTDTDKTRESRLRRAAARQGLTLHRSRARDPRAFAFGTYMLVDARHNFIVAGDHNQGFGLSLDDVERALSE